MSRKIFTGTALTEYGLALGLIGVLAIVGLTQLGGSIRDLIMDMTGALKPDAMAQVASASSLKSEGGSETSSPAIGASGADLNGVTSMKPVLNPATGMYEYSMATGDSQKVTNATSVDGATQWNATGSILLANTLEEMASEYPEGSAAYDWFMQMSKLGYYQGAVESIIYSSDGKPVISLANYSASTMYADLYTYRQQMKGLLESPPAGVNPQNINTAQILAGEIYNISVHYVEGSPSLLTKNEEDYGKGVTFAQLIQGGISDPYAPDLRQAGKNYVATQGTPLEPVTVTLTDAGKLEQAAGQP